MERGDRILRPSKLNQSVPIFTPHKNIPVKVFLNRTDVPNIELVGFEDAVFYTEEEEEYPFRDEVFSVPAPHLSPPFKFPNLIRPGVVNGRVVWDEFNHYVEEDYGFYV